MKIIYLECTMGAAGDMLMSALLELLDDKDAVGRELNSRGLPEVTVTWEPSVKSGIAGTHITVEIHGEVEVPGPHHKHELDHRHVTLEQINQIIMDLPVSDFVRANALAVYNIIAEAEAKAHGKEVEEIHFHEVGSMDAVTDIVGVTMLLERLSPDQIVVSPVHVGSGQVFTVHGTLPVPAPATAYILLGIPTYGTDISGELCTPTGAALLRHYAHSFGKMPLMVTEKIGYGMGTKNFAAANCVRAFWGSAPGEAGMTDRVSELRCNVYDMTPEAIGHAVDKLMESGALDVTVQPVIMKKNRPGSVISVLCPAGEEDRMAEALFRHTATLGIRRFDCDRYKLARRTVSVQTDLGSVRGKISEGFGVSRI
jgi:uncharacterized protein (TIGR00299 family) protein